MIVSPSGYYSFALPGNMAWVSGLLRQVDQQITWADVLGHLAYVDVRTGLFNVFFSLARASVFCLTVISFCSSVHRNVLIFLLFISSVWIGAQNWGFYVILGWARLWALFSCSSIMLDFLYVLSPEESKCLLCWTSIIQVSFSMNVSSEESKVSLKGSQRPISNGSA